MDAGFFQYNAVDSCCRVFRDTLYRKAPSHFCPFLAFGAGNTLLLSGVCDIRYRKPPPTVRNRHSVLKKGSYGTRRVFKGTRCKKQAPVVRKRYSVLKKGSYGTRRIFGARILFSTIHNTMDLVTNICSGATTLVNYYFNCVFEPGYNIVKHSYRYRTSLHKECVPAVNSRDAFSMRSTRPASFMPGVTRF